MGKSNLSIEKKKKPKPNASKKTSAVGWESSANRSFNPKGDGYDYETAKAHGLGPDETGHWPSRSPKTGQILKGSGHKTYGETVKGEAEAGYRIYQDPKTGVNYSRPTRKRGARAGSARQRMKLKRKKPGADEA
tara:strand:- start:26 stop:427 length:402 start_codon:yes stop_codon:yes gene_type:complete